MNLNSARNNLEISKLRLCFVGNMLGQNTGYTTSQGQIIADLFVCEGFEVTRASSKINRAARMLEIASVLIKNRRNFDVVILDVYSGLNLIMAEIVGLICKFFKLPLIMVLHGGNLPKFVEEKPRRMKRILDRANLLAAPSHFLAEKIGSSDFEIKVIPNVLDITKYTYKERSKIEPNLFWMRSFHSIYNPQMAIKVLAELKKSFPQATLTMAGMDKGIEEETKKLAEDLRLKDSVRFPGFLNAAKKTEEFSRADIFINTNHIDNMPVAVVEACAAGLPVVATEVGGLPYLLTHGENGLLVPNENVGAMVNSITNLIKKPELTLKLSANGRKLAEHSAWENVRHKWEKLFEEVLCESSIKMSAPLPERKFRSNKA